MEKLDPKSIWLFFVGALVRSSFFFIFLFAFFISSFTAYFVGAEAGLGSLMGMMWAPVLFILIVVTVSYIAARLKYHFYLYELGEEAYKAERGIIWKRYISIPYDRIQNVDIYRGVLDRILGLSDVQIHTAGYGAVGARVLGSEGRLPGLSRQKAEEVRDELIKRAGRAKNPGV